MRLAACMSASVPAGIVALGHAASNVRSIHESGTDNDDCVGTCLDVKIDQLAQTIQVKTAILEHRRNNGND